MRVFCLLFIQAKIGSLLVLAVRVIGRNDCYISILIVMKKVNDILKLQMTLRINLTLKQMVYDLYR